MKALVLSAALVACPMQLVLTTGTHSYDADVTTTLCVDTLVIKHGKTLVTIKGNGVFKSGFER